MCDINEDTNSHIAVDTSQRRILLNNEAQKNTVEKIEENPWIPDEAKKKYHNQRLGQSKWAFRLSFWGNIIGLAILIWSIYRGVQANNPEWVGVISGAVIEVISILFYSLSNKTNEKISEFFVELTKDSNIKEALKLSDEISERATRDQLKVKLALHLVGIDDDKICQNTNEVCKQNEK